MTIEASGLSINTMVTGGAMALFGFMASDFVEHRDDAPNRVQVSVLNELDLKLDPLKQEIRDMKMGLRTIVTDARSQTDELARRLSSLESGYALAERELGALKDRIDLHSDIIRERSLEKMK